MNKLRDADNLLLSCMKFRESLLMNYEKNKNNSFKNTSMEHFKLNTERP